jgi:hypothetical protein
MVRWLAVCNRQQLLMPHVSPWPGLLAVSPIVLTILWIAFHPTSSCGEEPPHATCRFEIRSERPYLDGKRIDIWGIRSGNALMSDAITERHIRNFDNFIAHGINCLGVYIQGSNGGWPDVNAGRNGVTPEGSPKPEFARRLEWLVREADKRGMVVMVGLISPRKDQELKDDAAVQRAIEDTAKFLTARKLRNIFVDLVHEYNSPRITSRLDHDSRGTVQAAERRRSANRILQVRVDVGSNRGGIGIATEIDIEDTFVAA